MCVQAVIEITTRPDGELPARLLTEAYRASDCGLIILVLNGVMPVAVDHVLDHVVTSLPLSIPGVRYVEAGNDVAVDRALRSADAIFVATPVLRQQVQKCEMECKLIMPAGLAMAWLAQRYRRLHQRAPSLTARKPSIGCEDASPAALPGSPEQSAVALLA